MSGIVCRSVMENCQNCMDSYGEICVGCNCCGRIDPKTANDCIVETNARHIMEFAESFNDKTNENYQKRNCALSIISFAKEIIKAVAESEDTPCKQY